MAVRRIDITTLKAFEAEVAKAIPGFKVGFKDTSILMKVLGFLSYPFNPKFMTSYTTTLGNGVWFPSQEFYGGQPQSSFNILAHELVHLHDERRLGWWMILGVVFPQVTALLPLALYPILAGWPALGTYGILFAGLMLSLVASRLSLGLFWTLLAATGLGAGTFAVLTTGWLSLVLLAGVAALAPWPSPSRTHFELRGYAMQLGLFQWMTKEVPAKTRESILGRFVGPDYFFMSWSSTNIRKRIDGYVQMAETGALAKEAPYDLVYAFCAKNGLVATPAETSGIHVIG